MPNSEQPDFDEDFEQAVASWREQHKLREDDAVLLLVELFRIHQRHWDELRRREIPSFEQFRTELAKLAETTRTFQGQSAALLDALKKLPSTHLAARVTRTPAVFLRARSSRLPLARIARGFPSGNRDATLHCGSAPHILLRAAFVSLPRPNCQTEARIKTLVH